MPAGRRHHDQRRRRRRPSAARPKAARTEGSGTGTSRAEESFEEFARRHPRHAPALSRRRVRVVHARGEATDGAAVEAMEEGLRARPELDHWYARHRVEKVGREQARLSRAAMAR